MSKEVIGSMVCKPVLYYDWVVPDFLNWSNSKLPKEFCLGPFFVIQNTKFCFAWYPNYSSMSTDNVQIWLRKESEAPITLARLAISLIGDDGSEKQICSKSNLDFKENYLSLSAPDAELTEYDLTPKFLLNGELRIRGRIEIKSKEIKPVEVVATEELSLVDDLRKEFADGTMSFTDFVLVTFNSFSLKYSSRSYQIKLILLFSFLTFILWLFRSVEEKNSRCTDTCWLPDLPSSKPHSVTKRQRKSRLGRWRSKTSTLKLWRCSSSTSTPTL
jgi:hypothetical protein